MKRWIPLAATLFCLLLFSSVQATIILETVGFTGDQGRYATIGLDSSGTPYAAWYDKTEDALWVAARPIEGWSVVLADTQAGQYASIAVNPVTDLPGIAYFDEANLQAKYAVFGDPYQVEAIVHDDDLGGEPWIALAYSSSGVPYITYHYDNGFLHSRGVLEIDTALGSWDAHRVDYRSWGAGDTGTHTAIALNSFDVPQIAYRNDSGLNLIFATDQDDAWVTTNATTPYTNATAMYIDLALDSGDNIFISTWFEDDQAQSCAFLVYRLLDEWSKEEIECGATEDFGKYTSIAIDSAGDPHVTYHGEDDLRYAVRSGKGWDVQVLDDQGTTGLWTSLALDNADRPHVVYFSASARDMRYAYDLPAPSILSVDPDTATNGDTLTGVSVTGAEFTADSTVTLIHSETDMEIAAENLAVQSSTDLTCDFDLSLAWIGTWDIRVTNPSGQATLEDGFTVETLPPVLLAVHPVSGGNDQPAFSLTLSGNYFSEPMSATLVSPDDSLFADSVTISSVSEAVAVFDLSGATEGSYDVKISTEKGEASLPSGFTITDADGDSDADDDTEDEGNWRSGGGCCSR